MQKYKSKYLNSKIIEKVVVLRIRIGFEEFIMINFSYNVVGLWVKNLIRKIQSQIIISNEFVQVVSQGF